MDKLTLHNLRRSAFDKSATTSDKPAAAAPPTTSDKPAAAAAPPTPAPASSTVPSTPAAGGSGESNQGYLVPFCLIFALCCLYVFFISIIYFFL